MVFKVQLLTNSPAALAHVSISLSLLIGYLSRGGRVFVSLRFKFNIQLFTITNQQKPKLRCASFGLNEDCG